MGSIAYFYIWNNKYYNRLNGLELLNIPNKETIEYYGDHVWTGTLKIKKIIFNLEDEKFKCIMSNNKTREVYIESGIPMIPPDFHPEAHYLLSTYL